MNNSAWTGFSVLEGAASANYYSFFFNTEANLFTTVAYNNAAVTQSGTDVDIAAVTDAAIPISNGHFVVPWPAKIIGAYGIGTNLTKMKVQTAKLRAISNPYIRPIERGTTIPNLPQFCDLTDAPVSLNPIDETAVLASNDNGAATDPFVGFLWIDDGNTMHPVGDSFIIRGTTAITFGSKVWTAGAITFDQTLPYGTYSVIGATYIATGALAARLVFPNQVQRPGFLGSVDTGKYPGKYFKNGYLGEFGRFSSTAQPQLECFPIASCATPDVYLQVIKVA